MNSLVLLLAFCLPNDTPPQSSSGYTCSPAVVGYQKLVIKAGQTQTFRLPANVARITFRGLNLVKESALTVYATGQAHKLAGQAQLTFQNVKAGTTFTLSNDGNWLDFSVEIVY